jgi:hypothetical protein
MALETPKKNNNKKNSGLDENIIGSVSYDYALGSIIKVQICEHKEIVTL